MKSSPQGTGKVNTLNNLHSPRVSDQERLGCRFKRYNKLFFKVLDDLECLFVKEFRTRSKKETPKVKHHPDSKGLSSIIMDNNKPQTREGRGGGGGGWGCNWGEGQRGAPTKTKSLSSEHAASYRAEIIHTFTSNLSLWLRHSVSQEKFTHPHVEQAHIRKHTHTRAHTHAIYWESHRTKKKENNWTFGFYPRPLLGFTVGAGAVTDVLTEHHQLGHWTDLNTAVVSFTKLRHQIHRCFSDRSTDVCSQAAGLSHEEAVLIWKAYLLTFLKWSIGHAS